MFQTETEAAVLECPELLESINEDSYTIVHCFYVSKFYYLNGGWMNMNPETYLVNHPFGEKIKMTHAINVPLSPECHYFKKVGEVLNFTLIFPKIPLSWDAFDLKELSGELFAFTVKDIERNHSGIYRVEVGQY